MTRIQGFIEYHTETNNPDLLDINSYTTQVQLQKSRLLAWVQALGVNSSCEEPCDPQLNDLFNDLYRDLSSTAQDLQADSLFDKTEDNHDLILNTLEQTN